MSKFPYPLDTPVDVDFEYEKQVPVLSDDKTTAVMKTRKVSTKIKTIYTKVQSNKIACGKGLHNWIMADRHKYITKCLNSGCIKRHNLNPLIHTIKEGRIYNKTTKQLID